MVFLKYIVHLPLSPSLPQVWRSTLGIVAQFDLDDLVWEEGSAECKGHALVVVRVEIPADVGLGHYTG